MDISIEKLNKMEAKLNEVLAEIDKQREEPNRVLLLINPTAEQYAEAWDSLSILDIVESHVEILEIPNKLTPMKLFKLTPVLACVC